MRIGRGRRCGGYIAACTSGRLAFPSRAPEAENVPGRILNAFLEGIFGRRYPVSSLMAAGNVALSHAVLANPSF